MLEQLHSLDGKFHFGFLVDGLILLRAETVARSWNWKKRETGQIRIPEVLRKPQP